MSNPIFLDRTEACQVQHALDYTLHKAELQGDQRVTMEALRTRLQNYLTRYKAEREARI
jgi:hypothetical protein